jgi:hypothetical protein
MSLETMRQRSNYEPLLVSGEFVKPQLPQGWEWYQSMTDGRRFFDIRESDGTVNAAVCAFMWNPSDDELAAGGSFHPGIERGTARGFYLSSRDMRTLGIQGIGDLERLLQ